MAMGLGLAGLVFGPVVVFFCWRYHTAKRNEAAETNTVARQSPNNHLNYNAVSHDNHDNADGESLQPLRKSNEVNFN